MKTYACVLLLLVFMLAIPVPAMAKDITVVVDGDQVEFERPPLVKSGSMLVPMRELFTALGAEVTWDEITRTALAVAEGKQISMSIGSELPTVDGVPVVIDVPAMSVENRTYIPLRFAAESLKCDVSWEAATETAIITTDGTAEMVMENEDINSIQNRKIDINTANLKTLIKIDGINENMAAELITYRDNNGLYKSFAELRNVPSVTDALFDLLAENIRIVYTEAGVASWYGEKFHGNKTFFGEIYDMNLHTAAHPTLPLDTLIEVTYLETGRSVWVRVNDRGPCQVRHPERVIDISRSAADMIGLRWIGPVELLIIKEK